MQKGTQQLSQTLLNKIFTTKTLKAVADSLEELAQNKHFKTHATSIITDPTLTNTQKKTQLTYLMQNIDIPVLYEFFTDNLTENKFWVLTSGKIDYFDKFVQSFQRTIESVHIVTLITSVPMSYIEEQYAAEYFSDFLGAKVVINHQINPALLAGIMVKIDNYVFDVSFRHKFSHFQKKWLAALDSTAKKVSPDSL